MLLPALSKAREKARNITCVNNQKQFALQMDLYAAAHDDVMMLCYYKDNPGPWVDTYAYWLYGTAHFSSANKQNRYANGKIYPEVTCPSEDPSKPRNGLLGTSYGYNARFGYYNSSWSYPVTKRGQVKRPTHTMVWADLYNKSSSYYYIGQDTGAASRVKPDYRGGIRFRHSGKANLLFLDGHSAPYNYDEMEDNRTNHSNDMIDFRNQ